VIHTLFNHFSQPALDTQQEEIERPRSPWTPSYSVTKVGSGPKEDAEIDKLEQLPAAATTATSQDNTAELSTDSAVSIYLIYNVSSI
jgi:hypothetical protein